MIVEWVQRAVARYRARNFAYDVHDDVVGVLHRLCDEAMPWRRAEIIRNFRSWLDERQPDAEQVAEMIGLIMDSMRGLREQFAHDAADRMRPEYVSVVEEVGSARDMVMQMRSIFEESDALLRAALTEACPSVQ